MARVPITPSQTVGPFFAIGLPFDQGPHVVAADAPGAFRLHGHVLDGDGEPVPDALVETWQASPQGRLDDPSFRGFGRAACDEQGRWAIRTVRPGAVAGGHAPHIAVSVFARGLLDRVVTRIYFPDEDRANAADPVLAAVPAERRATLLAERAQDGWRFDVRLQGDRETVFFDV